MNFKAKWYIDCEGITTTLLQERNAFAFAEGATAPETLRQKDCNNAKLWREVFNHSPKGMVIEVICTKNNRSSQVHMTDGVGIKF